MRQRIFVRRQLARLLVWRDKSERRDSRRSTEQVQGLFVSGLSKFTFGKLARFGIIPLRNRLRKQAGERCVSLPARWRERFCTNGCSQTQGGSHANVGIQTRRRMADDRSTQRPWAAKVGNLSRPKSASAITTWRFISSARLLTKTITASMVDNARGLADYSFFTFFAVR